MKFKYLSVTALGAFEGRPCVVKAALVRSFALQIVADRVQLLVRGHDRVPVPEQYFALFLRGERSAGIVLELVVIQVRRRAFIRPIFQAIRPTETFIYTYLRNTVWRHSFLIILLRMRLV